MRTWYAVTASMGGTILGLEALPVESGSQAYDWARLPAGNALVLVVEPDTQVAGLLYALELAIEYAQTGHNHGNLAETLGRLGRL